ncbi:hypothetical protein [Kribbella catacumbae]|uniref:hypothetical protein n=1 Tax=Kribbella catacumbae TaxID=460086 RepID=UPI000376A660|nr:hypothetical protein [Kribbella catacumbae]
MQSELDSYPLYHATRAELLRAIGDAAQANKADRRALKLTTNPAQAEVLRERLASTVQSTGTVHRRDPTACQIP